MAGSERLHSRPTQPPKARGAGEALSVALKVAMAWLKASWPRSVR